MKEFEQVIIENASLLRGLILEHVFISVVAIVLGALLGIFLGVLISQKKSWAGGVLALVNIFYTIPSIALLGFLISLTGIGNTTAILTLTIYALLPMVRSTYTGIETIDPLIIEASKGMGSTDRQQLLQIKLPLALPHIMTGLRNMATMTIALAGVASFVGAGGLGVAIYRGITTNNAVLTGLGSVLIALLAIGADVILGRVEKHLLTRRKSHKRTKKILAVGLSFLAIWGVWTSFAPKPSVLHMASKPTTEGYILGEMMKQFIEEKSSLQVDLTHGVAGGTGNIHTAMVKGDFDLYPDYTGTIWQIVLKKNSPYDERQFPQLEKEYQQKFGLVWTNQFGFNDTYGIAVSREIAEQYQLTKISDLARVANQLIFGAEYDFYEREDGFKALTSTYPLHFKEQIDMDNGLKYQAMKDKKIDVMTIFTTDGQLADADVRVLQDDRQLYPSYQAGGVAREEILDTYPELKAILSQLNHILDDQQMAELNFQVESEGKQPEKVAREYLQKKGLIK